MILNLLRSEGDAIVKGSALIGLTAALVTMIWVENADASEIELRRCTMGGGITRTLSDGLSPIIRGTFGHQCVGRTEDILIKGRIGFWYVLRPTSVTHVEERPPTPACAWLGQNAPNPFAGVTRIQFALSVRAPVLLAVFDAQGHQVANLTDAVLDRGEYSIAFDGSALASGTYFCRLLVGDATEVRKLLIVK